MLQASSQRDARRQVSIAHLEIHVKEAAIWVLKVSEMGRALGLGGEGGDLHSFAAEEASVHNNAKQQYAI